MGRRQIVLVSTAGFSVLNTGIFWREAKTKRLFSQCSHLVGGAHFQTHLIRVQMFNHDISVYSFLVNSFMAFSVQEV
jgi:hypothetical protein